MLAIRTRNPCYQCCGGISGSSSISIVHGPGLIKVTSAESSPWKLLLSLKVTEPFRLRNRRPSQAVGTLDCPLQKPKAFHGSHHRFGPAPAEDLASLQLAPLSPLAYPRHRTWAWTGQGRFGICVSHVGCLAIRPPASFNLFFLRRSSSAIFLLLSLLKSCRPSKFAASARG